MMPDPRILALILGRIQRYGEKNKCMHQYMVKQQRMPELVSDG